jgi:hypothetical protein
VNRIALPRSRVPWLKLGQRPPTPHDLPYVAAGRGERAGDAGPQRVADRVADELELVVGELQQRAHRRLRIVAGH